MLKTNKNINFNKSEVIDDFYKNFTTFVLPILNELEKERKIELTKLILYILGIVAITKICLTYFTDNIIDCYVWSTVITIFVAYFIINNFSKKLKDSCIRKLICCFGNMVWKNNTKTISDKDIEQSEIFGVYNKRLDDDSFIGTYKGVNYIISEVNLTAQTSGRRKIIWPVFKGVVIKLESNKKIKNKTVVTTKGDINVRNSNPIIIIGLIVCLISFSPLLIQLISFTNLLVFLSCAVLLFFLINFLVIKYNKTGNEKLHEIILEDPKFNKKFQVFSSDEIEARYLITTAFMDRFQNLRTTFGVRRAKCSFYNNNIMIALSTYKNLFEIGSIFAPVNKTHRINFFLAEITAIFDLIDYFKLNEKTGL